MIQNYFTLFCSKVEYRYSLLNQSERERDIDHDLENALHPTSVVFDDSDEEVRTPQPLYNMVHYNMVLYITGFIITRFCI